MGKTKSRLKRRVGWVFLGLWLVFIFIGIVEKRVFGHADRMVFYHFPAAVFLIFAGYQLSSEFRKRNKEEMRRILGGKKQ